MGLDKYKKTPCGFCFVEYYTRADAENCLRYINGTRLDDRIVRTDWDAGFIEGRQYGRGKTGGQVSYICELLTQLNLCKIYVKTLLCFLNTRFDYYIVMISLELSTEFESYRYVMNIGQITIRDEGDMVKLWLRR